MSALTSIQQTYRAAAQPIGYRANLGAVLLRTDETLEHDMRRLLPLEGVALYATRIPVAPTITVDSLGAMEANLTASASLLPPNLSYAAVAYGCTSATSVIGHERVAELIGQGCQAQQVVTPISGLADACRALGLKRLALVTPYEPDVNVGLRKTIQDQGLSLSAEACFYENQDPKVAQLAPEAVADAARAAVALADCDGVFISCTNVRTLDIVASLEADLGLPVLSSNLCLIWALMRRAGLQDTVPGFGRLMASKAD